MQRLLETVQMRGREFLSRSPDHSSVDRFGCPLKRLLVTGFVTFALHGTAAKAATGPVVQTASGKVQGFIASEVAEFLGLPYAAPPVGKLR